MKVRHSIILFTATLLPLHGQQQLDPLVVTATRSPGRSSDVPFTTSFIDADFLREQTRRTIPEALQFTPGVLVQKTANGHGSPFIRGFTGRQNLLLMDGIRLNNSTWRSGPVQYWNTIDPLSVEHMELVKSLGSVLYGSDAVGGTLNVFANRARFRDEEAGALYAGGSAYYEFRSNGDDSHLGRIQAETGIGGRFGILAGCSLKDFGDIRDSGMGLMRHTGYPEQDYDVRLDFAPTPDSTLTLASYYVNQDDIWRYHRTVYNPGWEHDGHVAAPGKWSANIYDQERSLTYLRYAGACPQTDAFINRWSATLSYQLTDDSEFMNRTTGTRPVRGNDIHVETFGSDLELESKIGPGELVYGFDFYEDRVDSAGYEMNANGSSPRETLPVADDSSYGTFGLFSQYTWHATPSFDLTGGARYTHVEADLGRFYDASRTLRTGTTQDWDAAVGSLRGIYRLGGGWSAYGGISQAFRAPNLDDLSGNMVSKSGVESTGNANVDPEKFITFELGTRYACENASLGFAAFYTDADDMIAGTKLPDGRNTTTNANNGYVYGFECEGAWRFHPQWELTGFTAWQDSRVDVPAFLGGPVETKPNSRQMPLSGSLALRWTHPSDKYWIEGRVLAADLEDRITAADQRDDNQRIPTGGTPGYVAASLRAGWKANKHLDFTLGLENITDIDYRTHGSGQNEPGFGAIMGARVQW